MHDFIINSPKVYTNYMDTNDALRLQDALFWTVQDVEYMTQALSLARQGADSGEVPVGALFVCDDRIIGQGFNQPIMQCDPTAHAEIVALRHACLKLKNYRLPANTTLYVTLEPCTMCIGALIHARVARIIFATHEPRAGVVGSQLDLTTLDFYNHKMTVASGLMQSRSQQLLKQFFKQRRQQQSKKNK